MGDVKNELLAPCGLYCGVCRVYIASHAAGTRPSLAFLSFLTILHIFSNLFKSSLKILDFIGQV